MGEHRFLPHTEQCVGCDVSRQDVVGEKVRKRQQPASCPALWRKLPGDRDLEAMIKQDDTLVIWSEGLPKLVLEADAMVDLGYFIVGRATRRPRT